MPPNKPLQAKLEVLKPPVSARDLKNIHELVGQLTTREVRPEEVAQNVSEIVENPGQELLVARYSGKIIGMATVTQKTVPSARTAYIDDKVVHRDYRGRGVSQLIDTHIVSKADEDNRQLQLTSRSSRGRAVIGWLAAGFKKADTNFFVRNPRRKRD